MTEKTVTERLESLLRRTASSLLKTEELLAAERAARTEPIKLASGGTMSSGCALDSVRIGSSATSRASLSF